MAEHEKVETLSNKVTTRLKDILDNDFPNRESAAIVVGKDKDMISRYASGKSVPPFDAIIKIAKFANVSLDWLAFGRGEKYEKNNSSLPSDVKKIKVYDIPSFPKTAFGMQKKAERECWKSQMRNKLGGGKEYLFDSLPDSAKDYILSKQIGTSSDIVKVETPVQKLPIDINELKPYQRDVTDARALILKELDQLSTVYGGINNAICKFQELINADELNEDLKNALIKANAKSGGRPVKISRATIFNWRKAVKENGTILALAQKEIKEAEWPAWGDALLKLWQRPQKPSLASCLETLNKNLPAAEMPSYSAAQRFLKKLPPLIFNKGRYGSRELKKFKAYVSRDTSGKLSADGCLYRRRPHFRR